MEAFNIGAGRDVGIIKTQIREAILEGEIKNSKEEAYEYMLEKGKAMGLIPVNIKS